MGKINCKNCSKLYDPIYMYKIYIRKNTPDKTAKINYKYKSEYIPIGIMCEVCGKLELYDDYYNLTKGKVVSTPNPKKKKP